MGQRYGGRNLQGFGPAWTRAEVTGAMRDEVVYG